MFAGEGADIFQTRRMVLFKKAWLWRVTVESESIMQLSSDFHHTNCVSHTVYINTSSLETNNVGGCPKKLTNTITISFCFVRNVSALIC